MDMTHVAVIFSMLFAASWTTFAQECQMRCGPGYWCALVRYGQGLPVPDCITMEEALLLEQAVQGGPIRTGASVGVTNEAGVFGGIPNPDKSVVGQPLFTGVLQPIVNVGDFIQQVGLLRAHQRHFIDPQYGVSFLPRLNHGVPIPLGLAKRHHLGFGPVPRKDADRAAVGTINSGGKRPEVIEDRSRQIRLNININNNNVNQNIDKGSAGTQIDSSPTGGCSSNIDCPALTQCCHHVCSKTCISTNKESVSVETSVENPVEKPISPKVV